MDGIIKSSDRLKCKLANLITNSSYWKTKKTLKMKRLYSSYKVNVRGITMHFIVDITNDKSHLIFTKENDFPFSIRELESLYRKLLLENEFKHWVN